MGLPVRLKISIWSTNGLCKSTSNLPSTICNCTSLLNPFSFAAKNPAVNSSIEPIQVSSVPSSVLQIGNGVPQ